MSDDRFTDESQIEPGGYLKRQPTGRPSADEIGKFIEWFEQRFATSKPEPTETEDDNP